MHLHAERRVQDDAPVAEFVAEALDDERLVGGNVSGRLLLVGDEGSILVRPDGTAPLFWDNDDINAEKELHKILKAAPFCKTILLADTQAQEIRIEAIPPLRALDRKALLKRRLGGWRHQQLQALMQSAIDAHLGGNPLGHKQWIRVMLQEYYDPMYAYQLERKADRLVFKGSYEQVLDYLAHAAPHRRMNP